MLQFTEAEYQEVIARETQLKKALQECARIACEDNGDVGAKVCETVAAVLKS